MKTMKIFAALFIAFMAMNGCTPVDNPIVEPESSTGDETLKAKLFGTWYRQYDATGTINGKTYKSVVEVYQFPEALSESNLGVWDRFFFAEADDENPIDNLGGGSGSIGMFEYAVSSNGTVKIELNGLYLIEYDPSLYRPFDRTVTLDGNHLMVTGIDGQQLCLDLASEDITSKIEEWHVFLNGGDGGGEGAATTEISDTDAYEPSLARKR